METSEKELIKDMLKDTLTKQIELKQPPQEEIKKVKERKVKTMFEAYLLNFFETLKDADSPDAFDKWAENKKVDDHKNNLCEFFQDTLSILQLNGVEYDKEKPASEFINKALFLVAERRCEEAGVVERVKKQINDKTAKENEPNLIDELDNKFTQEMYEEQLLREKQDVIKQVDNIEQNWDNYKDEIQKIQTDISKIKQTDLEQMSIKLNGIVDIGKDAWTLVLLGILSPYTPQVVINGLEQRNAIHTLLIGDISCLPKGTLVKTPKGFKPIEKVKNVVAYDFKENKLVNSSCVNIHTGMKKIIKIHTPQGILESSYNHLWYVKNGGGQIVTKLAKDLLTTDYLLVI
jgi:hypothetical protein